MIQNSNHIAILLATYNGEKFLKEQLESLYAQTCTDWTLFVRDDLSTDSTLKILQQYASERGKMQFIENNGVRLGAMGNFMTLLEEVESDYYMFMDEDDVWLPRKIENEYQVIEGTDSTKPQLVITNIKIVDNMLHTVSESFWHSIRFTPRLFDSFQYQAYMCYVTGCTMMFNHKAKLVSFPIATYAPMHDWWIAVCVYRNNGKVSFLSEPQMLYRKHGGNVTGDFVASQQGKSITKRVQELICQYTLLKKCGCINNIFGYLRLKYKVKYLQRYSYGAHL